MNIGSMKIRFSKTKVVIWTMIFAVISHPLLVNAEEKNTIFIFGDSRTCGLMLAMDGSEWVLVADERVRFDQGNLIYENDTTRIVFSVYGGATIDNGYFEECVQFFWDAYTRYYSSAIAIVDLFGLADNNNIERATTLNEFNNSLQEKVGTKVICYQGTLGPIGDFGEAVVDCNWSNEKVQLFNEKLKENDMIEVIDIAGMLQNETVEYQYSEVDISGLHYTRELDRKIVTYILEEVLRNAKSYF